MRDLPPGATRKQEAEATKEALAYVEPIVRRLAEEVAERLWGLNGRFRRKWRLSRQGTLWRVEPVPATGQSIAILADLGRQNYRVDGLGEPIFTEGLSEEQLRRAFAVALHRQADPPPSP